ncbi:hypothetical protein HGM15179_020991 [Zosterops borbonicus]|uniref:Ig-like domain-containing protein n=1 Tax=Zosterops borbonicus TaxID=364589 RepID=A0A8K1D7Q1_9PASS|nr:hypothetical protein HGM15179_020991 [Zosterops borbonicus]
MALTTLGHSSPHPILISPSSLTPHPSHALIPQHMMTPTHMGSLSWVKETLSLHVPPHRFPHSPTLVPAPPPGLSPVSVPAGPVANATITPSAPAHQVHTGDPVTLRCSVQVGSAPVTFTWLHNGREVSRGPVLELADINVGHSGTYQCVATNQLGQDGHRLFRALSPELALEVTPQGHWNRGGVIGSHWDIKIPGVTAARKHQERAPSDPLAPPEEGEVLYTHVVSTKQMGGEYRVGHTQRDTSPMSVTPTQIPQPVSLAVSPRATTLQDPQVTYAELQGPHGRQRELSDTYGNVL